jgi:hypothetical protein
MKDISECTLLIVDDTETIIDILHLTLLDIVMFGMDGL